MVQALIHSCRSITAQLVLPTNGSREMEATLKLDMPSLVFLEAEDCNWCIRTAAEIHGIERTIPIIAFSRYIDTPSLLELMRVGVREWVEVPANEEALRATIERIRTELHALGDKGRRPGDLVCFLPGKPGSGCSTVAAHAASLCARASAGPVALFDLDLTCGTLQFITEAAGGTSLLEAAQHAHQMDESLWTRLIARSGGIHLMHNGSPSLDASLDPHQLHCLLNYAANHYPVVIADLSGNHERFAIHALEQATQIYMVCSPDLTSLYLARRQLQLLKQLGVVDRLELIVNRAVFHGGLGKSAIEEILGRKPVAYFPNAYLPLQRALKDRSLVSEDAPFSRSVSELVLRIMKLQPPPPGEHPTAGGWLARTPFTHTLQALRAAIHSFRPPGSVVHTPAKVDLRSQTGRDDISGPLSKPAVVEAVCEPSMIGSRPPPGRESEPTADPPPGTATPPLPRRRQGKTAGASRRRKPPAE
jgi:Flp pilus assembly CpaE family ATPase